MGRTGGQTRFLSWLRSRDVHVLHLVRGAAILRDNELRAERSAASLKMGDDAAHVHDLSTLAKLQAVFKPRR